MKSKSLRSSRKGQAGFTLVEIAIVLVIVGLLLGGVLKGQELIDQSRIKRVVNDFNNISAAIYTYQDRYNALPGDDSKAVTRWTSLGTAPYAATAGSGDGSFGPAVLADVFGGGGNESGNAWQHLRAAGLVTGDLSTVTLSQTPEKTPFGSSYGIGLGVTAFGFGAVPAFCASLPPKAAESLDRQLDDGDPAKGNIRANAASATMDSAPGATTTSGYVDAAANPWITVCKKI